MRQLLKNKLKEQKGLTLIELLAVIVILGIIAAIAVPSILGLINNSKLDAHVANGQQMLNAAKMAVASEAELQSGEDYLSLQGLIDKKYLDKVESPKGTYSYGPAGANILKAADITAASDSYVYIKDGKILKVQLVTTDSPVKGITVTGTESSPVSSKQFTRDGVTD
ncbi:type II secretion system protein [Neobacillus sp. 179-J 1A1 HS]|uniref:pilus assembly FimT family protein n=1 Tax=Neobacillus driksii TaxID=3035913 RepID=UPI0035BBE5A6